MRYDRQAKRKKTKPMLIFWVIMPLICKHFRLRICVEPWVYPKSNSANCSALIP